MPVGIVHEAVVHTEPSVGMRPRDAVTGRAEAVGPMIHVISHERDDHTTGFRNSVVAHPDVGIGSDPIDLACALIADEFEVEYVSIERCRSVEIAPVNERDLSVEG